MEAAGWVVTLVPAQLKGCRPPGPVMGPVGDGGAHERGSASASLAFACLHTQCFCVHDAPAPTTPQGEHYCGHFTDKAIEAQEGQEARPKPHRGNPLLTVLDPMLSS